MQTNGTAALDAEQPGVDTPPPAQNPPPKCPAGMRYLGCPVCQSAVPWVIFVSKQTNLPAVFACFQCGGTQENPMPEPEGPAKPPRLIDQHGNRLL